MKIHKRKSLNRRIKGIAIISLTPIILALIYALVSLADATTSYAEITRSISYANEINMFKERMDYSLYQAVSEEKRFAELEKDDKFVTIDPYQYIEKMERRCDILAKMATVDSNASQITELKDTLNLLENNVKQLEGMINSQGDKEENMTFLVETVYEITSDVEGKITEYIEVETKNLTEARRVLNQHNKQVYVICICISVIAIIITIVLTGKALKDITRPITKLCDLTQKVSDGDFTVRCETESVEKINEIEVLANSFNDMTEKIGTLVDNIKEQEQSLHLMETKLLQAQINPHFLYNTLDTIVWLAEDDQSEEVVSMVTALSDFFRTTLSNGKDFVTVEEEEIHISSYLKIQQFRYQDIVDYEIEIDKGIKKYIIPKLLLQPLVENALYHGIKNKRGKGYIKITGNQEDDHLIFKVSDTGKGIKEELLKKIQENISETKEQNTEIGYGLTNISRRIKHYYGENGKLVIDSKENEGTEVTIIINTGVLEASYDI